MINKIFNKQWLIKSDSFFYNKKNQSFFTNVFNFLSMNYLEENLIGRWKVSNNNKIISLKVDQANEDHCGCCNFEQQLKYENEDYYRYFCN